MSMTNNTDAVAAGEIGTRSHDNVVLIFDYDGTIHDSLGIYAPALRRVYAWLVSNGYAPMRNLMDSQIAGWLGWSTKDMWNSFMPDLSDDLKKRCAEEVGRNMYWEISNGGARMYPGARQTLVSLKDAGYKLVFLSNCDHGYMEAHNEAFKLDEIFSGFYCTGDYDYEPKPKVFEYIERDFGLRACAPGDAAGIEYVAIGDRFHDIELATTRGLKSIGCLYGFGDADELAPATAKVNSIKEIPAVLASWGW